MDTYIRKGAARRLADGALSVLMALITPLLEKNPAKALATPAGAFVFSMSRLIVLALPLLGALDRASPEQVLALGSALIGRFGIGEARVAGWGNNGEPNRFDNHR